MGKVKVNLNLDLDTSSTLSVQSMLTSYFGTKSSKDAKTETEKESSDLVGAVGEEQNDEFDVEVDVDLEQVSVSEGTHWADDDAESVGTGKSNTQVGAQTPIHNQGTETSTRTWAELVAADCGKF